MPHYMLSETEYCEWPRRSTREWELPAAPRATPKPRNTAAGLAAIAARREAARCGCGRKVTQGRSRCDVCISLKRRSKRQAA